MRKQTILLAMLLAVSTAFAQVKSYDLSVGDKYEVNQETNITMDIEAMGSSMQTVQKVITKDMLEVIAANSAGYEFKYTTMNRKIVMTLPMAGEQTMDSDGTGPMDAAFKAMINRSITFTMDKYGRIKEFKGLKDAKKAMKDDLAGTAMAAQADQLTAIYSESVLKSLLQGQLDFYAGDDSKEWNKNFSTVMNELPVDLEVKMWYDTDNSILADGKMLIKGEVNQMGAQMSTDLKGTQNSNYDLASNGMPTQIQTKQEAEGSMTAQGMELPVKMSTMTKVTFTKK